MAAVELREGDTLKIIWTSTQQTPFGNQEVESRFVFSYDELLHKLRTKGKMGQSRKSVHEGARFSRTVSLSTNALRKGTWSTGAEIERKEVFNKLMERCVKLEPTEYVNITSNARRSMIELYRSKILKPNQRAEYQEILLKLGVLDPKDITKHTEAH